MAGSQQYLDNAVNTPECSYHTALSVAADHSNCRCLTVSMMYTLTLLPELK